MTGLFGGGPKIEKEAPQPDADDEGIRRARARRAAMARQSGAAASGLSKPGERETLGG